MLLGYVYFMGTALKDQKLFKKFCSLNSKREEILTKILVKESIPHSIVPLEDARHIFIFPENLNKSTPVNVLVAHYDRVKNTPGANDNSASIFYLLNHAKRIKNLSHTNVIIFTDREEITGGDSVTNQGSYNLGRYFKSRNLKNLSFFIFDMCGIGTTLLLGTAGENLIREHYGDKFDSSSIKEDIKSVKENAEEFLLDLNGGEFFYLNPLFSDDLGLILNEYPSVLFSLLPYREAVEYKRDPSKLPKSWRCNHTIDDRVDTLDPKSWGVISPLLLKLTGLDRDKETTLNENFSFKCYTQKLEIQYKIDKLKAVRNYITEESFSYHSIKTYNTARLRNFLLFSSKTTPDIINYLNSIIPISSGRDMTYDIFNHIKELVNSEFNLLPLKIRDCLYNLCGDNSEKSLISFLYRNTLLNIEAPNIFKSTLLKNKESLDINIKKIKKGLFNFSIYKEKDIVGEIIIKEMDNGFILDRGDFNPEIAATLDPLNMLKGVRIALIKWVKLNNNNSLRINLDESLWIGCYQFFNLIKAELEGRSSYPTGSNLFYIWKRYYGKQS